MSKVAEAEGGFGDAFVGAVEEAEGGCGDAIVEAVEEDVLKVFAPAMKDRVRLVPEEAWPKSAEHGKEN